MMTNLNFNNGYGCYDHGSGSDQPLGISDIVLV